MEKRKPVREYNGLEDHIKRLHEATENIEIFIASAYSDINGEMVPSLGIRDRDNKGVIIDGTPWLIAGTVYHSNKTEIRYLSMLKCLSIENIYIDLRAQASIYGCLVHVDLGKRKITHIEPGYGNDRIFAHLEVM